MAAKVSIIVPVYNAEKTLATCLGNLVHQTLEDIELILVNDCSTDNSLQILLDCERAFPEKVMLVDLAENLGAGGARNVGLSYASGEYIGFVDSDDIADPTMYQTLYERAINGNYDMVDCAYYNEATDTLRVDTGDECVGDLTPHKRALLISGGGYLWSRLIRRDLFNKAPFEEITFREHTILEDMETLMQLFISCERLGTVKKPLYKYCDTSSSLSKNTDPAYYHKAITDAITAVYAKISTTPDYQHYQAATEYSIATLLKNGLVNAMAPRNNIPDPLRHSMVNELIDLRRKYISIPFADNNYIRDKFTDIDYLLINSY